MALATMNDTVSEGNVVDKLTGRAGEQASGVASGLQPDWQNSRQYRVFAEVRAIFARRWKIELGYIPVGQQAGVCATCHHRSTGNALCRQLAAQPEGRARCRQSDEGGRERASEEQSGVAVSFACHAGMTRISVPVHHQGRIVGFVESGAGGFLALEPGSQEWHEQIKSLTELGYGAKEVDAALRQLVPEDESTLSEAIELARLAALSLEEGLQATVAQRQACREIEQQAREQARRQAVRDTPPVSESAGPAPSLANPASPPASAESDDEREVIVDALERANGNRERAAALLNMSRATFFRRMKKYGLSRSSG